jgi:hypothetical protein
VAAPLGAQTELFVESRTRLLPQSPSPDFSPKMSN